jgi:NO-binding membrane sensor protein with MHYT domain
LAFLVIVDFTAEFISTASIIKAEVSFIETIIVVAVHAAAAFIQICTRTGVNTAAVDYTALEISIIATGIRTFHFTGSKDCGVTCSTIMAVNCRVLKRKSVAIIYTENRA